MGYVNAPAIMQKISQKMSIWCENNLPVNISKNFKVKIHTYLDDFLIRNNCANDLLIFTEFMVK